jgi:hypothetical protein
MIGSIEVLDYDTTQVELYRPDDDAVIEHFTVQEVAAVEVWVPGPYSLAYMLEQMP